MPYFCCQLGIHHGLSRVFSPLPSLARLARRTNNVTITILLRYCRLLVRIVLAALDGLPCKILKRFSAITTTDSVGNGVKVVIREGISLKISRHLGVNRLLSAAWKGVGRERGGAGWVREAVFPVTINIYLRKKCNVIKVVDQGLLGRLF